LKRINKSLISSLQDCNDSKAQADVMIHLELLSIVPLKAQQHLETELKIPPITAIKARSLFPLANYPSANPNLSFHHLNSSHISIRAKSKAKVAQKRLAGIFKA
jgi:hypothetical protein